MKLLIALVAGFILDLIIGDPRCLIHPVQIIGWVIDKTKKLLFKMIYGTSFQEVSEKKLPRKKRAEMAAGFFLTAFVVGGTFAVIFGLLYVAGRIHPYCRMALETIFIWQILATKSLKKESMRYTEN